MAYGIYYVGRLNLGAAVPGLCADLGYTKEQLGWVLALLKIGYAAGQLINGQLSDRRSARKLLALGLAGSALCNLLFGLASGIELLAFIWFTNGYFQAMGWTPCVKIVARWTKGPERGRAMGFFGTSYQVGAAVVLALSGPLVRWTGSWRVALYLPAAILVVGAIFVWFSVRESPEDHGGTAAPPRRRLPLLQGLRLVLTSGPIWLFALSLAGLNAARYGFMDWAPTHLTEAQGAGIDAAALQAAIVPAGGIFGSYLAGWVSDRLLAARRAPVVVVSLLALAGITLIYGRVAEHSVVGAAILLFICGILIFGPQVLLVGTAPADFAREGTEASAAGFINMMGYIGAAAGDAVTGTLAQQAGWGRALWFWAGAAALSGLLLIPLWRRRA